MLNIVKTVTYRIAENFDSGKFWRFPARPSKFNQSNYLKTIQYLQVYSERQWPSFKIFSVKYLKSQYPSKFPPIKILHYTVPQMSLAHKTRRV